MVAVISKSALIRGERSKKKISQMKLSTDTCTQSTLSRIETERHNPNAGMLGDILGQLYLEDYYFTMPTSMDYEVEKRKQNIKKELYGGNIAEADRQLKELLSLETSWDTTDWQFIRAVTTALRLKREKPGKELYEEILDAIYMSIPKYAEDTVLEFILSETEIILLDNLSFYFEQTGEWQKAKKLMERVFFCIEKRHKEFEIYLFGYLQILKRLITLEIKEKDYASCYSYCCKYVEYCRTYGMWAELLEITMERAWCEKQFESLDKAKETVVEAYFGLLAAERKEKAEEIRERAKEELGICFRIKSDEN